jgi:hypothetical protein
MDGQQTLESSASSGWKDHHWILLGMVLVLLMRLWQLGHTEVASRDTLTYIRVAWQLEHGRLQPVLKQASHHPGYPATILAVAHVLQPLLGDDEAQVWQVSAQVASGLASILLFLPTFYLGRQMFSARISFWASLLLQCLPAGGRVMGDGLSEALFLLCASTGLLLALRGVASGCVWQLALAGLCSGLAYLTRPEGVVVAVAAGLVLLALQWTPWRKPWRRLLAGEAGLVLATLAVAVPFMVLIGKVSVKIATTELMQTSQVEDRDVPEPAAVVGGPLWAKWQIDPQISSRGKLGWGARTLAEMLAKGFFYVLWLPALVGLWWYRERFRSVPGAWVLALTCLLLGVALFRVASYLGYLSERHTLVILMCGMYWAVAAVEGLALALARFTPWASARCWLLALLLPVAGWGTVKSLQSLHTDRIAYREAGYWMASHTDPEEVIYDPFGWTSYYAGQLFHEPVPGVTAPPPPPPHYVVIDNTGNSHPHLKGWPIARQLIKDRHGQLLQAWPCPHGQVEVYELDRPDARVLVGRP